MSERHCEYNHSCGINRIRLEFKVGSGVYNIIADIVLIESDWNLKKVAACQNYTVIKALIESDWNLKFAQLNKDLGEDMY